MDKSHAGYALFDSVDLADLVYFINNFNSILSIV